METGSSALFPNYSRFPITLVKGEGSRVWDDRGNEYLDFVSGLAVTNLGHVPAKVRDRLVGQLDQLWHVSNLFQIPDQERLAQLLTKNSAADAVFFCNSGAEANEAAIKLARRYHHAVAKTGKYEIITFTSSFHGRTLATLTATGQDKVKDGFDPLPEGFRYVPFNDAGALEAAITDKTGAVMLEMVQGEGGVNVADRDFVQKVEQLCKSYGLLLIVDEIQTGMGRTGSLFAYEQYGIEPDIFTLAKGLGSGFPIGAMLAKRALVPAFGPGSHGSTFGGTPIASAVGLATLETMLEDKLPQRAAALGEWMFGRLHEQLDGNPLVRDIRGRGLFAGIACTEPVAGFIAELQKRGLLTVAAGPQVLRLLPALTIAKADLERGISMVCEVLAEAAKAAVTDA